MTSPPCSRAGASAELAQAPSPANESANSSPALFTFPNRVLFGLGARRSLAAELNRSGVTRPLIVTDPGLVELGLVAEVTSSIQPAAIFQGVQGNPTEADVLAGLDRYHASGSDGLIGLGGGKRGWMPPRPFACLSPTPAGLPITISPRAESTASRPTCLPCSSCRRPRVQAAKQGGGR